MTHTLSREEHGLPILGALLSARLQGADRTDLLALLRSQLQAQQYDREFDESQVNRDRAGKFAEVPGAGKPSALRRAVASIKELPERAKTLARKLWVGYARKKSPRARKRLKAMAHAAALVEHVAMAGFHAGKKFTEQIAREKGHGPAAAERAARIVAVADQVVAWTTTFPLVSALTGNPALGKAASFAPLGSLAYLAYSTADDPLAVWRAARKAVGIVDKPAEQHPAARPGLESLAERFAREWDEAEQARDNAGKFAPEGSNSGVGGANKKGEDSAVAVVATEPEYVSAEEHATAVALAREKLTRVPQPTEEQVKMAREGMARLGANRYRKTLVGNVYQRKSRRQKLYAEFGDGKNCPCLYCGVKLGEGTLEQDKILTTGQGGRYVPANIVPACGSCNKRRLDMPFGEALEEVVSYAGAT